MAEKQHEGEDEPGRNPKNIEHLEDQNTESKGETAVKNEEPGQAVKEEASHSDTIQAIKAEESEYSICSQPNKVQYNIANETGDEIKPSVPSDGQTTNCSGQSQVESEKRPKNTEDNKIRVRIRKFELKQDEKGHQENPFTIIKDVTITRHRLSEFLNKIIEIKENDTSEPSTSSGTAKQPPDIKEPGSAHRVLAVKTNCNVFAIRGVQQRGMYQAIEYIEGISKRGKNLTIEALDIWCNVPNSIDTRKLALQKVVGNGCFERFGSKYSMVECSLECKGKLCNQDAVCKAVEEFINRKVQQEKERKKDEGKKKKEGHESEQ